MEKDIYTVRDDIVNRVLTISVFFIVPLHIAEIIKTTAFSWNQVENFFLLTTAVLVSTWIFRKKVGLKAKFLVYSVVFILAGIGSMLQNGLMGAYIFLFIPSLLAVIVFGKKIGIYYCLLTTGLFALIGYGFSSGILQPFVQLDEYHSNENVWITAVLGFLYFTVLIIYSSEKLYTYLMLSLKEKTAAIQQYQLSENRLQKIIDNMPAMVFLKDSNSVYKYINQEFKDIYSIDLPVTGKSDFDIFTNELAEQFKTEDEKIYRSGLSLKKENEFTINDSKRYFLTHKTIIPVDGNEKELLGISVDITDQKILEEKLLEEQRNLETKVEERTMKLASVNKELISGKNQLEETLVKLKETQSQLIQSEKMASLGILTSGVAHEINNPLNYIQGGYNGIKAHYNKHVTENDENVAALFSSVKTGIDRVSNIVKSLNQFSRHSDRKDEVCDFHSIIDNCLFILNSQIDSEMDIVKNYTDENIAIIGNLGQLHQVSLSIIDNAIQSIEKNGRIVISTNRTEKNINIEISDNGSGIPEENLDKIILPFFTTKEPGKGTGLGLSIAYSVIKEHSGSLNFESKVGEGTKVKIILPVTFEK